MVTKTKAKSRHPRTLLKCYRMFLVGSEDSEMEQAGFSVVDISKCKKFHQCMREGKTYYNSGKSLKIPEHISKTMSSMLDQWKSGDEITFGIPSGEHRPNIASAYALLLAGTSESEMREICTEMEIEKAKMFTEIMKCDKLYATISKEVGMPVSTIKKLKKMYRDYQTNLCMETA